MENKNNEIKETLNNVEITGVLVKNGLEVRNSGQEDENISGALVLRTEDGSEHDIRYYATRFKKKDGKFTSEESKLYPSYITMLENYKSLDMLQAGIELSDVKLGEDVDVIKTGSATFKDNDFMGKDGNIVSTNQLKATFANRVKPETIESTVRTAKFEVSGIITKMELETRKDGSQTGNGIVRLDMMSEKELEQMFSAASKNFSGKSLKENRVFSTSTSPLFAIDTWRKVNPTAAKTSNTYMIINTKNCPGLLADGKTSTGQALVNTRSNQEAILAPNKLTYKKMEFDKERGMFAVTMEAS